jgi:hypothetical protein
MGYVSMAGPDRENDSVRLASPLRTDVARLSAVTVS